MTVDSHVISQEDYDDLEGASCSNQHVCTSSIHETDYMRAEMSQIQESISNANMTSTHDTCASSFVYPNGGNTEAILDQANSRKRQMGVDHDYSEDFEWRTTKFFR